MPKPLPLLMLPLNHKPFLKNYTAIAKDIVLDKLKEEHCRIFIFGSRARGDYHRFSDLDIGIIPLTEKTLNLADLQDYLNYESMIPFKVEIVNFAFADDKFKDQAMQKIIWWRE